jgi:hypothetical protein
MKPMSDVDLTCCVSAAAAHNRIGRRGLQKLVSPHSRPAQCQTDRGRHGGVSKRLFNMKNTL